MRILLLGLLALSCTSNEYTEGPLETRGSRRMAWSSSLRAHRRRSDDGALLWRSRSPLRDRTGAFRRGDLDALKTTLMASSKLDLPGTTRVGRSGSIPAGPTVRWELESGGSHNLLYYVPSKDRYVLIALTAPAGAFDRKSDQMEMALSTLKLQ